MSDLPERCPSCGETNVARATEPEDVAANRVRFRCASCGYDWTESVPTSKQPRTS